jgi:hypothetical protein
MPCCNRRHAPNARRWQTGLISLKWKSVARSIGPSGDQEMPATPHVEKHFTASETVRDVVIGMADGLTVPFALAAGLSAAVRARAL